MVFRFGTIILLVLLCSVVGFGLEPNEILVIANSDVPESVEIAQYYRAKRKVPEDNILALPLGPGLNNTITRDNYEKQLAEPIRQKLATFGFSRKIRCLLTTYGVPFRVGKRVALEGMQDTLEQLRKLKEQTERTLEQLRQKDSGGSAKQKEKTNRKLMQLQSQIDRITGKETDASVDSELSMVLTTGYELYRWQPNKLKDNVLGLSSDTLMVSRLDGPQFRIVKGLVDKALAAEKMGLIGLTYIDSRGLAPDRNPYSLGWFDQSLRDLAMFTRLRTKMSVKQEQTEKLFAPRSCPGAAIYCGWYSLEKYVDAFDFVDGAIGFHISSLEAVNLRDPNSTEWVPAMLMDGITATLGAVAEPYLHSFPEPARFFSELYRGRCLVEAYYYTKPFNSWQLVLIGDPLYTPFRF
jgi:uncharacterized protein (TIGR03790 family)